MDGPPRRPLSLGLSVQLAGPRSGGSARTAGAESQPHARSFLFLRESSRRPTALVAWQEKRAIDSPCSSSSSHHCQHLLLSPGVSGPAYQAPPPVCRFPGSQLRVLAFPRFPPVEPRTAPGTALRSLRSIPGPRPNLPLALYLNPTSVTIPQRELPQPRQGALWVLSSPPAAEGLACLATRLRRKE